jgi:succinate dehydrogenase / fumarate reductase cytochrome b subunit
MKTDSRAGSALPPGRLEPLDLDLTSAGLARSLGASIGKKYLMAWTGLFWCFFVLMHLVGNLGIYLGKHAYNSYSAKLLALGPILVVAEVGLLVFLLAHAILAVLVTLENSSARPEGYAMDRAKGGRNFASNTMIWTGLLIFVFLVLHVWMLKYGDHETVEGMTDLHGAVVTMFANPGWAAWYVLSVVLLGFHVGHGLQSSLRTIGWNSERSFPRIRKLSVGFGFLVAIGYASIPFWAFLTKGGAA